MSLTSTNIAGANAYKAQTKREFHLGTKEVFAEVLSSGLVHSCTAVYIEASAALVKGNVYWLPLTTYDVSIRLTKTLASSTYANAQFDLASVCFPLTDIPDGSFGWAAVAGVFQAFLTANSTNSRLGLTDTAGLIGNDSAYELRGAQVLTTHGGSNALGYIKAHSDIYIYRNAS